MNIDIWNLKTQDFGFFFSWTPVVELVKEWKCRCTFFVGELQLKKLKASRMTQDLKPFFFFCETRILKLNQKVLEPFIWQRSSTIFWRTRVRKFFEEERVTVAKKTLHTPVKMAGFTYENKDILETISVGRIEKKNGQNYFRENRKKITISWLHKYVHPELLGMKSIYHAAVIK